MFEETIKKVGNKYVVYPKNGGKRLGTHDTLSAAKKQLRAIEMSKHEDKIPGGLAGNMSLSDIAKKHGVTKTEIKKEFKLGIKVEMEHTSDPSIAAEIALDHLVEDPKYYTKLDKMENPKVDEDLRKWFKEKWVRFGPDGKIRGQCARGSDSEGKPKCLPQAKAHALGKKGRASAARRKRREDPNPERRGKAKNVNTKKEEITEKQDACYHKVKSRYKVWPSAYASGALVKCRKVGAKNWGNSKKEELTMTESYDIFDETTGIGYTLEFYHEQEGLNEAEYQGRKVALGKPMRGDVKKFKVYVKNDKGNVVKVNFGDPNMRIKKSNPARRKSFRARHKCSTPGPRWKARYWSCRKW